MTEDEKKLEERKVKALEKIGNSLDALTIWFEEIEKDEWDERIQYYLSEWKRIADISVADKIIELEKKPIKKNR